VNGELSVRKGLGGAHGCMKGAKNNASPSN
jgi:hypothetical protein